MTIQTGRAALLSAVAAALMVAGCGGEDDEGEPRSSEETTTQTNEPVITAPPTKSPEEKAEAEIIQTFEGLIADWDDSRANASDYGGEPGWNSNLVSKWRVEVDARTDLTNWVGAWRNTEIETNGATVVGTHDIQNVNLNITDSGIHEATSVACLDQTGLEYQTYDGEPADPEVVQYQTWTMAWEYAPNAAPESGLEEAGWYVHSIELVVDEPC